MRLKRLHPLCTIVDECETCALATTVLCSESEAGDLVFLAFVEFGELGAEFVLGDVGALWVENIAVKGCVSVRSRVDVEGWEMNKDNKLRDG